MNTQSDTAVLKETAAPAHRTRVLLAVPELERHMTIDRILGEAGDIAVVGSAASGTEAVQLTELLRPSLVIMGVDLPLMNGFRATKEIMIRCPTPVLIVGGKLEGLSSSANASAYRAGALSYLPEIPILGNDEGARAFLDVVDAVAHSTATRYWRIRQGWESDAEIQAVAVFVSNASVIALAQMLRQLPQDFAAPIVVLPYIGRGFTAGFAGWLRLNCPLAVRIAADGDILAPGTVYIAPDDRHLKVVEARTPILHLSTAPAVRDYRPSGSYLLSTLSRVYGPRGLALVMEGVREDLVSAMCAIWLEGGHVFAQTRTHPKWYHWPPEEILLTLADGVMTPTELAESLKHMVMVTEIAGGAYRPHGHGETLRVMGRDSSVDTLRRAHDE